MPAATTKAALLEVHDKEWRKLSALLEDVPDDLAEAKDADDTSIKDILTHRAHWIGLYFQWLEEGEDAQMPDHGVKWNALKPYNAGLRERYAGVPFPKARETLTREAARLRDWIAAQDEDTLYAGPMPGGTGWTRGRYAEAAGPSHFRSAAKYVRARLKAE
ncbi:ClbS/DfsB family four-helix bundle protein [Gymnodinialimonas hymeniacidonis]|uniref:ClbS/DfsB family four-helix bundle protein n=1 Tax=Gymnodinialimonas hymeniacidonis TaxID=3126508 RepID=UPI0034C5E6B8